MIRQAKKDIRVFISLRFKFPFFVFYRFTYRYRAHAYAEHKNIRPNKKDDDRSKTAVKRVVRPEKTHVNYKPHRTENHNEKRNERTGHKFKYRYFKRAYKSV